MIRTLFLILSLFFLCLSFSLNAQNNDPLKVNTAKGFSIMGNIKDTLNFTNCGYASVSLVRASDSILQNYTRTDENGNFKLQADSATKYLLLVSHPSFATYIDLIEITKPVTTLDPIMMTSKKQMLNEVVITDAKAIVLKGDTIEYAADSFKTRAFDNVDELLKQLPGIEIDKDGKIKAYGKEVKNMTVDGEEFFSDDPAIVAKTLRASSVDKVQVFDKKSEQAAFTGIDDGNLSKTINLKLKDDAKHGYFGKVGAGGGFPSYWEDQAMINAFSKKRKIAAYGIMSNTNNSGLDWDANRQYGGGSNNFTQDDDGSWVMDNGNDLGLSNGSGQYNGQGLPRTWTSGALYSNKWMGDTLSLNANYKYGKLITEESNNTRTQYLLPDTQYINNNNSKQTDIGQKHLISANSKYWIDTSSSIAFAVVGKYDDINSHVINESQSTATDGTAINENSSDQQTHQQKRSMKMNVDYNKKFKKKGQTFAASFAGNWNNSNGDGTLVSAYHLYTLDSSYNLNQSKTNTSNGLTGSLKLAYTQPVIKDVYLNFNYKLGLNRNTSENNSYDRTFTSGVYQDTFNPNYSSKFQFNNMQNYGGVGMRFDFKKLKMGFNANVSHTNFKQNDVLFDTTYNYSYTNFLPNAYISYDKSQMSSFSFRYNTSFKPPTIYQLQPLRNNTDPLNITIGNPSLHPSYTHNFDLGYYNYKVLASRNIYANVSFADIENGVSQVEDIDISGRRTVTFQNVSGNYSISSMVGYGRKLFKAISAYTNIRSSFDHNNNFINGLPNANNILTVNPDLGIYYNKDTTFTIQYNFAPAYSYNHSSVRADQPIKNWTYNQRLEASYNLPWKFTIGTKIDWNIRQKLDPQDTKNDVFLWNAYLQRAFLKDRSLVAKVYVNDILNQNQGYNRYNTATYISESSYNTIRRYAMFSLTWNFTKTGNKAPVSEGVNAQ